MPELVSRSIVAPAGPSRAVVPATRWPRPARLLRSVLDRLRGGSLEVAWPDGTRTRHGSGDGPLAVLELGDWSVCAAVWQRGDIGLAEAWMDGRCDSPDLAALLRLCLHNRDALAAAIHGSRWGSLLYRLRHALRRNNRAGSRRNIAAHYDLGNDFYALWLDATMNYSSACFDGEVDRPLEEAQRIKMRRALVAAGVRPGARVLEIGCGWGAIAELATAEYGATLTGLTLSKEQLAWGRDRLARQGLAAQADLRLEDYRDHDAQPYDAAVSIEMFEAVGRAYWPAYFRHLHRLLRPGASACVQTITIRDDLFESYARSTDFIQQYVFPGGMLPSPSAFRAEAERAGFVVEASHAFGPDYAETLRRWRAAFLARWPEVQAQGFDLRFRRLWLFYLAYCEAAFDAGSTDVIQFTLRRP